MTFSANSCKFQKHRSHLRRLRLSCRCFQMDHKHGIAFATAISATTDKSVALTFASVFLRRWSFPARRSSFLSMQHVFWSPSTCSCKWDPVRWDRPWQKTQGEKCSSTEMGHYKTAENAAESSGILGGSDSSTTHKIKTQHVLCNTMHYMKLSFKTKSSAKHNDLNIFTC